MLVPAAATATARAPSAPAPEPDHAPDSPPEPAHPPAASARVPVPPPAPVRAPVPPSAPARGAPATSRRPGPNTASGPNLNTARVDGVVAAIEDLKREMRKNQEEADKREKVMYKSIKLLQAKLAAAEARVVALMEYLEIEEEGRDEGDDQEPGGAREQIAGARGAQHNPESNGPTPEQIKRSEEACESVSMKLVINTAFKRLMGVTKLTGSALPPYPKGLSLVDPAWPQDSHSKKPLLRFEWDESEKTRINDEGLKMVLTWIQASGGTTVPRCQEDLADVLEFDLVGRIAQRWKYLRKEARKHQRATSSSGAQGLNVQSASAVLVLGDDDDDDDDGDGAGVGGGDDPELENAKEPAGVSRSVLSSRAKGKCSARSRKRVGTIYEDRKYDAAFTPNAMSDDEDDPDAPFVDGKATQYVSRAPGHRSNAMQTLVDVVDPRKDPNSVKEQLMVKRVRGPPKLDAKPPRANKLSLRLRAWQIDPAYLAANPDWLTTGRVAISGIAWGDLEDPKEDEKVVETRGKGGKGRQGKIRRVGNVADVAEAQAQLDLAAGGVNIDSMFDM
ncbi:hypothetical protein VTO73DRAFT_2402 [Trametes versicolor]